MQASRNPQAKISEGLTLKKGDTIELVAPASRCKDHLLTEIIDLFTSWGLNCLVDDDLFGDDLLCANTDEARFTALKNALEREETKAIICVRGGYGSQRLIPRLHTLTPPKAQKLFVGMSDITALNLFFENHWQWRCIHAGPALDKFSSESIRALRSLLFGEQYHQTCLSGIALNQAAIQGKHEIQASITGGNLCLVQTSIGTLWQVQGKNKILFLEEIGERGYRIDRMLQHCRQAGLFKEVLAIILGDFTLGQEPDGSSLIQPVLHRFAEEMSEINNENGRQGIPVVHIAGLGHGPRNHPLPLGVRVTLQLGERVALLLS